MSFALQQAAQLSSADCPRDRFVLSNLADRANEQSEAWPSVARISSDTGLSERAVQKALRSLREAGHISVVGSDRGGANHATIHYLIHPVPCPERLAKKASRRCSVAAVDYRVERNHLGRHAMHCAPTFRLAPRRCFIGGNSHPGKHQYGKRGRAIPFDYSLAG